LRESQNLYEDALLMDPFFSLYPNRSKFCCY